MQVSVTIIARDAQIRLPACLDSIKDLTNDVIVVVDDRTKDNTDKLAREFGAEVYRRKFNNYADQHNFADQQTENDWIFSLDADETASPRLVKEVKSLDAYPAVPAFRIPRKNKIFGKYINHSNWDPDGLTRLFNKRLTRWEGEVHEELRFSGKAGQLTGEILHDNYQTVSEFIARQNIYSILEAQRLYKQGSKFGLIWLFWTPVFDFGRRYIWHAGFLDGWHGLYLGYLMAIYHLSVWIKLWQLEKSRQE